MAVWYGYETEEQALEAARRIMGADEFDPIEMKVALTSLKGPAYEVEHDPTTGTVRKGRTLEDQSAKPIGVTPPC